MGVALPEARRREAKWKESAMSDEKKDQPQPNQDKEAQKEKPDVKEMPGHPSVPPTVVPKPDQR